MFIPPVIRRVKKCQRCELLYPRMKAQCTHCIDLTDQQVEELKKRYEEEHKGNANLGRFFIYIAILIALSLVIINSG